MAGWTHPIPRRRDSKDSFGSKPLCLPGLTRKEPMSARTRREPMSARSDDPDLIEMFKAAFVPARKEGSVTTVTAKDGLSMFVYPSGHEFILGVGYRREHAHMAHAETVLRARTEFPSRYAAWL